MSLLRICRACRSDENHKRRKLLLLEINTHYATLFNYCLGLNLSQDELHGYLCKKCAEMFENFSNFKSKCLLVNETFSQTIKSNDTNESFDKSINEINPEQNLDKLKQESIINDDIDSADCNDYNNDTYLLVVNDEATNPKSEEEGIENKLENNVKEEDLSIEIELDCEVDESVIKKELKSIKTHKCYKCKRTFKGSEWFKIHLKKCDGPVKKKIFNFYTMCGLCGHEEPDKDAMKAHFLSHLKDNLLNCQLCTFTGIDFADVASHCYSHMPPSETDKSPCIICGKRYINPISMLYHMRSVHLKQPGGFCHLCKKTYANKRLYTNHMKMHRAGGGYICDHCGIKYTTRVNIIRHLKFLEIGIKKYVCDFCGNKYRDIAQLKTHQRCVHIKQEAVRCDPCNKIFKNRDNYRQHVTRMHSGFKHHCRICKKGFAYLHDLNQHEFFHTGAKPHVCNLCGLSYKMKANLTAHLKKHAGILPHLCGYCNKAFFTRKQLVIHESVHTGKRLFECHYCSRSFNSKQRIRLHHEKEHKMEEQ